MYGNDQTKKIHSMKIRYEIDNNDIPTYGN